MKSLNKLIEKIKTSLKLKKTIEKSINMDSKEEKSRKAHLNTSFLNEHNRKILKRYHKPIVKELPERKRIYIEVRDVLDDIEERLKNGDIDC